MIDNYIPLSVPYLIGNEKLYVDECIGLNAISTTGSYIDKLETEFAKYVGMDYAVATSTGSAALHLAMLSNGISKGHEVFAPVLTNIASINAISISGAKPVFVDIDADSLGISPESVQRFIDKYCYFKEGILTNRLTNRRITAILAVHVYGHSARIDELQEIADNYKLKLIEDAAEAIGTKYKNKNVGAFGNCSCFSFDGKKIMTTGQGGMIVTNDELIAQKVRHLSSHAVIDSLYGMHDDIGFNYSMSNINAAIGVAQMEYLDQSITTRRKIHYTYEQEFKAYETLHLFSELDWCKSNCSSALLQVPDGKRNDFIEFMGERGIQSKPLPELNNRHPMYGSCSCSSIDNSKKLFDSIASIPCNQMMADDDIERVVSAVKEFVTIYL